MKTKTNRRLLARTVCLGLCFTALTAIGATPAGVPPSYLDSLVSVSSEIVEGRFVRRPLPENKAVADMELTAVYKGDLKPGQIVSVDNTDRLYVLDRSDGSHQSPEERDAEQPLGGQIHIGIIGPHRWLKEGDRLFLFLDPRALAPSENLPRDRTYYWLSSARLVWGDRAVAPEMHEMPMWTGFVEPSGDGSPPSPTVAEFRQAIAKSISWTEELRQRIAGKPSTKDRDWLLKLLRQHLPQEREDLDYSASMALSRIKKMHDLALTNEAVALFPSDFSPAPYFGEAYDFPAGRNYLLKRIADRKAPMNERVKAAYFLQDAGWPDDARGQDHSPSRKDAGHQKKAPTPYLTRLADYAWEFRDEPELCEEVLDTLRRLAQDSSSGLGGYKDLPEARAEVIPIMEKFAADGKTDEIRDHAREAITQLHR